MLGICIIMTEILFIGLYVPFPSFFRAIHCSVPSSLSGCLMHVSVDRGGADYRERWIMPSSRIQFYTWQKQPDHNQKKEKC